MHRNRAKVVGLWGAFSAFSVLVGSRWGRPGLWIAVLIAAMLIGYVYFRRHTVVLRAMRAYPVSEAEQPVLHRVVRELIGSARTPMPRLYVSPTRAVNAFATGATPATAVLCCTEGIIALLDDRELRAVVAHELAHVRRGDTLLSSTVAVLAGVVMGVGGRLRADPRNGRFVRSVDRAILLLLGPLAAAVVRASIRRNREYAADAEAVRITGDPLALAAALRKIDASTRRLVLPPERGIVAGSHLMIVGPLQRAGVVRLFSSHPPTADRVARLEQRAGYRR